LDTLVGILSALSMGVVMTVLIGTRARGRPPGRRPSSPRCTDLVLDLSVADAAMRCRTALQAVAGQRGWSSLADDSCMEVVTGSNIASFGTAVRAEIEESAVGVRLSLTAWPARQLFDWGESRRVLGRVVDALQGRDGVTRDA
jgi:hypothetical protein